jgi:hypothetical protein
MPISEKYIENMMDQNWPEWLFVQLLIETGKSKFDLEEFEREIESTFWHISKNCKRSEALGLYIKMKEDFTSDVVHDREYFIKYISDKEISKTLPHYNGDKDKLTKEERDLVEKKHSIYNVFCSCRNYFLKRLKEKISDELRRSNKKYNFYWRYTDDALLTLFNNLISSGFIDPNTSLISFSSVFKGFDDEAKQPVKWIKSNRLFAYFLNSLFDDQNWQSIAHNSRLFINKSNKVLNRGDLAVANYNKYGIARDSQMIDKIVSSIKNP